MREKRPDKADAAQSPPAAPDLVDITRLLPHRYPFQFVDRVVEFIDGKCIVAIKNVSRGDFFFRGHFPDDPVMPGVLICEALAQTGALLARHSSEGLPAGQQLLLSGLDHVRFRRRVVPGDQLRLEVTLQRSHRPLWRMRGVASVDGELAAQADILAMEIDWGGSS